MHSPRRSWLRSRRCAACTDRAADRSEPAAGADLDRFKIAVEEYRFQVGLNWSRTQYSIVLGVGILGLATGLLRIEGRRESVPLVVGLYAAGVLVCILALLVERVQRGYYRSARDEMVASQRRALGDDLVVATTPSMTGRRSFVQRLGRVTTFHNSVVGLLLLLNLGGLVLSARLL